MKISLKKSRYINGSITIILLILTLKSRVAADSETKHDADNGGSKTISAKTPEDLKNMSLAELRELPAHTVLSFYEQSLQSLNDKKNNEKGINETVTFVIKNTFRDLLYDIPLWSKDGLENPNVVNAIKEVQSKFGEAKDGVLTFYQYERLQKIANIYKTPKDVYVGDVFNVMVNSAGTYALVSGTLEIEGEEIANPINFHAMHLDKESKVCRDINYSVSGNDEGSGFGIHLDQTFYQIISWEADEVVCKNDYRCRSEKVIINFKEKSAYIITTNREGDECKDFPKLKTPRVSKLVDPSEKRSQINMANRKLTEKFISDDTKTRLQNLFKY